MLTDLDKLIHELERSTLEEAAAPQFELADLFDKDQPSFIAVRGLANFWSNHSGVDFVQCMTDLVIGAHQQQHATNRGFMSFFSGKPKTTELVFVLVGNAQRIEVLLSLGDPVTTRTILQGIFPGIDLAPAPIADLVSYLEPYFRVKGMMSGIPSRKGSGKGQQSSGANAHYAEQVSSGLRQGDAQGMSQLERIIRGMYGATWAYVVKATPCERKLVVEERGENFEQLTSVSSQMRTQTQSTDTTTDKETENNTRSHTTTTGGETINYRAQYLMRLLECEVARLDQAVAAGFWTVTTYFGASQGEDALRLASLLTGTLGGSDSRPAPLRTHFCGRGKGQDFSTYLTSDEVATLIQLPREEVPGYAIHDFVRFDSDMPMSADTQAMLALGKIQQNGHDTNDSYRIALDDLTKHAVVVGVTGSGKTNTVMNILDRMVSINAPFLIIEPAKTEYRALRGAIANRKKLRIYTLGNETHAPFRLNPFECETSDDQEYVSILNHIDFLKNVFNAAFILYAPMPYVLETALHEVYEDKGWDLATGRNLRLDYADWKNRHLYPIFPTLTDLYHKIEDVTNRLRYDREIEQNIKAGLKARIGSMRLGAKGLMLDTARGVPMQELLAEPTLLEMEEIGSDEEKTFLMGLLLAKIYEFRRLQYQSNALPDRLHLIVFEEAHRLLKNTSTQVDSESSNMRAQAIETFTNMLSEIRAYRQGVLVAEQIPAKLAPDVLKNTNLKIVHRLIAQDDRESVGQTMNLNEEQKQHLGILVPGMAAVYAEGADHAYLVKMDPYKKKLHPLKNEQVQEIGRKEISVKRYYALQDMDRETYKLRRIFVYFDSPEARIYEKAGKILEQEGSRAIWANILLRAVHHHERLPDLLRVLKRQITSSETEAVLHMVLVRGCAETLAERGAYKSWRYVQVDRMRIALTQGLIMLAQASHPTPELIQLANRRYVEPFGKEYVGALKLRDGEQGPFAGCVHCPNPCAYRAEMRHLLSKGESKKINDALCDGRYETEQRYQLVARTAIGIAGRWLQNSTHVNTEERSIFVPEIAYCALLHTLYEHDYNEYEQEALAQLLNAYVLNAPLK